MPKNLSYFAYFSSIIKWSDTSRFGYQMLTKMGWENGKGLGANEDGSTTHVKATKRRDNLGKAE